MSIVLLVTQVLGSTPAILMVVLSFIMFGISSVAMITGRWGRRLPRVQDESTVNDGVSRNATSAPSDEVDSGIAVIDPLAAKLAAEAEGESNDQHRNGEVSDN